MITKSLILAAGLLSAAAPAMAHGNGWGNGGNNGSGGGGGSWNQPRGQQVDTVGIDVNRWVGNETLPLRQLGGLNAQYRGRILQSVVVELSQYGPAAQVQLLIDGQVVDAGYTNGKQQITLRPNQNGNEFGGEFRTMQLRTVGWAPIDDINVNVLRQGGGGWQPPQPPQIACHTVERQVNAQVRFDRLNLNSMFNLGQYNGCRIGSITVFANTAAGRGQMAAMVNGAEASSRTQVAAYPGLYTLNFWNQPAIGGNAPQVALNMMGVFTVQTVRLNLVNGGGW